MAVSQISRFEQIDLMENTKKRMEKRVLEWLSYTEVKAALHKWDRHLDTAGADTIYSPRS